MSYRFQPPRYSVGGAIDDFSGAKLFVFQQGTTTPKTTFSDFALTVENSDPVVSDSNGFFGDIFLDISATVTLKTSNDVVIYGPTDIIAPDDSVDALSATSVTVADTAGNFDASNVETVLAEISDEFFRLDRANSVTATQTFSGGNINMGDNRILRPELTDYSIAHNSIASVSGTLTIGLTAGNSFATTLTENITTISIINPPVSGSYGQFVIVITQDSSGGAYTVTWPASVTWPSGTAPTITVTNGAIDEVTLRTFDAGVTWRGSFSQAFA